MTIRLVNKAEHAVQSYAAGIRGQGARKPGAPIQCVGRASLLIGVNDGERGKQDDKVGKGGNKTTKGGKGETRRQKSFDKTGS